MSTSIRKAHNSHYRKIINVMRRFSALLARMLDQGIFIYFFEYMRAPMICLYAPLDTKAACIFTKNTTSEVVFTGQGQRIRFSIF